MYGSPRATIPLAMPNAAQVAYIVVLIVGVLGLWQFFELIDPVLDHVSNRVTDIIAHVFAIPHQH